MPVPLTDYPFSTLPPILQTAMIYYPIIAVFGIPANVITIVILHRRKCGLSRCITSYLVAMASADLLVLITDVVFWRIKDFYFPNTFLLLTNVCPFNYFLARAATDISVWLTVAFTFDRFITICCQKLRTNYCSEKIAKVVIGSVSLLLCSKNIPFCFAFCPYYIIDNVAWGCKFKMEYYTEAAWVAFTWTDRSLNPLLPALMIILLNALTVGSIFTASKIRRKLRESKNDADKNDPEMEKRRKSIILLFTLSGNFLLLWMMFVILFVVMHIKKHYYATSFEDPMIITDCISFMLLLLSTCTNTCIYAVTQTKFREELKTGIKYAVRMVYVLLKHS
ncbi:probable G-protein coupled receptor 139 [Stegostoma tigrinum]|uniref:probable G-protein coupled receptor 139 n=1 Tax=Stegostoma tigrinum TaxID=3053191 RepID=UPI002870637B|nr:probable G-protein coupled receptor 139 [Stegostoma tigrinum]